MASLARRNRIKEAWLGIPESWRTQLASAWNTFFPAFAAAALDAALSGEFSWTRQGLVALLTVALRAGFKPVNTQLLTRVLPDPKN